MKRRNFGATFFQRLFGKTHPNWQLMRGFSSCKSLQSLLVRLHHSYSVILKIRVLVLQIPHTSGKEQGGKVHFLQLDGEDMILFSIAIFGSSVL